MSGNDKTSSQNTFCLTHIRVALALLTRLPLPHPPFDASKPAAHAAWAYPLVGVVIASLNLGLTLSAIWLGLPVSLATLLGLLGGIMCTGAMHEDGLADCADGFWGGWTSERRLEIMKDSQIGTYGVLVLLVSIGLRWQALTLLMEAEAFLPIIAAAVASRSAMVWVMYSLPNARHSGLSHHTGQPQSQHTIAAIGIGLIAILLSQSVPFFTTALVVATVTFGCAQLSRTKIGGQTGDVIGATQQVVEIAVLLVCLAAVNSA